MELIELTSAKKFLRKIGLEKKNHSGFVTKAIFRGQRNADWNIVPSACRENVKLFNEYGLLVESKSRTKREQVSAEFITIEAFCNELNQSGFHIPNEEILRLDGNSFQHIEFLNRIGRSELTWPPPEYHSITAVAQHYGIPTRFIDWTYDPYIAAYFAANGALQNNQSGHIAVYAVDLYHSGVRDFDFTFSLPKVKKYWGTQIGYKYYQLIKAPAFFNANLKAQKGLFLAFIEKEFIANDPFVPYSFEEFLEDNKNSRGCYKYVICTSKAEEIMYLLYKKFYKTSTVFPSIEGCVESVYETQKWD